MSLVSHSQASNDVDVANGDLLDVMTVLGEDLHARTLIASITNDEFAVGSHDCNLAGKPQLSFFFSRNTEMELERPVLLEYLKRSLINVCFSRSNEFGTYFNAMIVGVGDDDFLVKSQAETVRRIELATSWAESTKLNTNLHWRGFCTT